MAWDSTKTDGVSTLPATEYNDMVTDQKGHKTRHNVGGTDALTFPNVVTTQTDQKASRAVNGTVYQNTGTKPMFVNVVVNNTAAFSLTAQSDSGATPTLIVDANYQNTTGVNVSVSFIVLPNNYYKVTATQTPTIASWIEWT